MDYPDWRNISVIASHNPRLYKERLLGQNRLTGTASSARRIILIDAA